ncbi:MAG TPA: response regulator [Dehalococcoidia bacterium]|jgi:two-component system cell cycle response regulator DivK|nr:response regulator [Dehalococcoidia bacterium]
MKILLIDDNAESRDLLTRRLTRRGYDLLVAVDGANGLATAATEQPDLILLDVDLPALDGLEAARRLKHEPATRAIPVIALTAHARAGERERALAAGCDDYESKPVVFERLVGKIEALCRC